MPPRGKLKTPRGSWGDRKAPGGRGRGNGRARAGAGAGAGAEETSFSGSPQSGPHNLTLAEEALNTERRQWGGSDQMLRYSKVSFVSGGIVDPLSDLKAPYPAFAGMTLKSPPAGGMEEEEGEEVEVVVDTIEVKVDIEEDPRVQVLAQDPEEPVEAETQPAFVIDIHSSSVINTGIPRPRVRDASPTPSNSSEEVILFTGRNNQCNVKSNAEPCKMSPKRPARTITDPIHTKIKFVEKIIAEKKELLRETLQAEFQEESPSSTPQFSVVQVSLEKELKTSHPTQNHPTRRGRRATGRDEDVEDKKQALIADYLTSINNDDALLGNASFNERELGGSGDEWIDETGITSEEIFRPSDSKTATLGAWNPSEITDFNELTTSDGVLGDVQAILAKRDRVSGVQYLVVWQDQTFDEARWVHASVLTSIGASERIEEFEIEEKLINQLQIDSEDDSTDSDDLHIDQEYDENNEDQKQRKIYSMTDESIARLLAKQEQLGMGSNELLLFDDEVDAHEEDGFTLWNPVKKKSIKNVQGGSKRPSGDFPAASTLADAYDGFDIMDWDRPSLQKKSKGHKGKLVFDISDSDRQEAMQDAWNNDLLKKKGRKQKREEMRAAGLLGSKNGKDNLKKKHQEGMGFNDVKGEIKMFLIRGDSTLVLPPMDKADRKLVHEIANAFGLKSKSAGDEGNRHPLLYRTKHTSKYIEQQFEAIEKKLSRRYLHPMPAVGKAISGASKRAARSGGGNNAAVSYRDGDIVGGSAPELGADNKGRAMLEKMGWSTGTALGALNNKGIMQPVTHVVKTTKAGLG